MRSTIHSWYNMKYWRNWWHIFFKCSVVGNSRWLHSWNLFEQVLFLNANKWIIFHNETIRKHNFSFIQIVSQKSWNYLLEKATKKGAFIIHVRHIIHGRKLKGQSCLGDYIYFFGINTRKGRIITMRWTLMWKGLCEKNRKVFGSRIKVKWEVQHVDPLMH